MPDRNRTGPDRYGPLTGRGLGPCGDGLRRGFGRRLGFRRYIEPVTMTKEEQKKILEEELQYIEIEKNSSTNIWDLGVGLIYSAQIGAELAKLEEDQKIKVTLLKEANTNMETGVSQCNSLSKLYPIPFFKRALADYEDSWGEILNEYYSITKEKECLLKANMVYNKSAENYKLVDWPNRAAESYWKIAKNLECIGEYKESSENYEKASKAYDDTSKKIPQLKKFCDEHSTYMKAWSQIEQARYNHSIEDYNKAREYYKNAAILHNLTESWSYVAPNYFALANMEEAENLSRKENPQQAKEIFQKAYEQFCNVEDYIQQKLEEIISTDEKEMVITQ